MIRLRFKKGNRCPLGNTLIIKENNSIGRCSIDVNYCLFSKRPRDLVLDDWKPWKGHDRPPHMVVRLLFLILIIGSRQGMRIRKNGSKNK
jgi:hypothetical protein